MTSFETRQEALKSIDKQHLYRGIIEVLKDSSQSLMAEEIACKMKARGYKVEANRQGIQPRCTELERRNVIAEDGARLNPRTGKMNVTYKLVEGGIYGT